jgi:uncharacterized coiled-coil protein SlyX
VNGTDIQQYIEILSMKIAHQETELADLESEILDIEQEIQAFTDRYKRLIKPLQDKLAIIQDIIAELEKEKYFPPASSHSDSHWTPPSDYIPVEEQFRQTWRVPNQRTDDDFHTLSSSNSHPDEVKQELKTLYRRLARRYHPDLATDTAEREQRNRLMAEINAAYSERNLDVLRALDKQPEDARIDEPIAVLQLRQLQQIHAQLSRRVEELHARRRDLISGEMMSLKIQASLAARHKRDLLREMADQLERDYRTNLDRLDKLRG